MFRHTDEEKRSRSDKLMKQAEDQDLDEETLRAVNKLFKQAISLRWSIMNITHEDKRIIAECHVAIACNIRGVYDESADGEFETRTRHPDFFEHMKLAIYAIDSIPFDQQKRDDLENVDCWYGDISTSYYYFRIPDEAVMDDDFLRATSKYLAKKMVLYVQDKLAI